MTPTIPTPTTLDLTGINRSAIARATGIDLSHISRTFNRKSQPSLPLALSIAAVLGVTVEELCMALGIEPSTLPKE